VMWHVIRRFHTWAWGRCVQVSDAVVPEIESVQSAGMLAA
jgi:hypothetical protein